MDKNEDGRITEEEVKEVYKRFILLSRILLIVLILLIFIIDQNQIKYKKNLKKRISLGVSVIPVTLEMIR